MWFYYSLIHSFLTAISIVVSKRLLKNIGSTALIWVIQLFSLPLIIMVVLKEGIPSFNLFFLVSVIGSVVLYSLSKVLNFRAIRMSDLSKIYPLVSFGPIFTAILASFPPLSEKITLVALVGILITIAGSYVLNVETAREGLLKPFKLLFTHKASFLMIVYSLIISVVVVFDKLAINNTFPKSSSFALLSENMFIVIGLIPILYIRDKHFLKGIIFNKKLLILLGLLTAVKDILGFSAVGQGNIGLVTAVNQTETFWVLLLSYLFFLDKPKTGTIIASVIMILGVVLIKIGS